MRPIITHLLLLYVVISGFGVISVSAESLQAPELRRGINLSNWFANAKRQPLRQRDFQQIRKAGFDHVRIPIAPETLGFSVDSINTPDFLSIDRAMQWAWEQHLSVILDIHPSASFMNELESSSEAQKHFLQMWQEIARHYAAIPQDLLVFSLLNEPHYYHQAGHAHYQRLISQLVATVRKVEPQRLLIVSAPEGSSLTGLLALTPLLDSHIAYDFHFYEPYIITHQGIHRMFEGKMLRYFSGLPYPYHLAGKHASQYAATATSPVHAQQELDAYANEQWDGKRIAERISLASQWAETHHTRLLCTEFGVLRNHIAADSRYRWIEDTRKALEQHHIGWTLWDYSDLDGITILEGKTSTDSVDGSIRLADPAHGKRHIEPAALSALGLQPHAP